MTEVSTPNRVFITGALGFIGRRLAERYRAVGVQVSGVDMQADPALGVVAGDITEPGNWQDALKGAETVIHTAARVGFCGSAESYWRVNSDATRKVLDAAVKAGVRRFVHISSIVAFGFDYPDGVDERHPLRTNGVPYVDTKVASEWVVLQAHAAGEMNCTIIRPGDVYGPGSYFFTVIPVREIAARRFVLPAMGRGHVSPVFIDDLVEGIVLAAGHEAASGQVFTLTGGVTVESREFFSYYSRMLRNRIVFVAPTAVVLAIAATTGRFIGSGEASMATIRYLARKGGYSIEKARSRIGYHPTTDLAEGMRHAETWLRENNILPRN
ncbi:MAG: NAD-dependent epimerase/dehydratase family protein [Planctomycetaceae bacterium]